MAVLVVAFLLGMRWAVEPGNVITRQKVAQTGRSAGLWFTLGFVTTLAGLIVLVTVIVRLSNWPAMPALLALLAVLEIVILLGAVRARRNGAVPRPGFDRLFRRVRRAPQVYVIGVLAAVGPVLAAEMTLLVPAGGSWSLVPAFAAGMGLATAVPGVRRARAARDKAPVKRVGQAAPREPRAAASDRRGTAGRTAADRRGAAVRTTAGERAEIAIVTGAGTSVGQAVAPALAGAGYGVVAADLDPEGASDCAALVRVCGAPAIAVTAALCEPADQERLIRVAEEWGPTAVLVNAGTDIIAGMRLSGLIREPMRQRSGGAIINLTLGASADASRLIRFTSEAAGAADGVRLMCLTIDQADGVPQAVLALIRRGNAGAVIDAAPVPRFARGTATVG